MLVASRAPFLVRLAALTTPACSPLSRFTTLFGTDACDPSPTLTFADATTAGSCPQSSVVTRTWTATDHCGNSATRSQVITVVDTTAPVLGSLPGPSTVECPAAPSFTTPTDRKGVG